MTASRVLWFHRSKRKELGKAQPQQRAYTRWFWKVLTHLLWKNVAATDTSHTAALQPKSLAAGLFLVYKQAEDEKEHVDAAAAVEAQAGAG